MAITPKEAEDKYIENIYRMFKECEKKIDILLVNCYDELLEKGEISFSLGRFFEYASSVKIQEIRKIAILIQDRYPDWNFEYDESNGQFIFKYKSKNQPLLNMISNSEERFKNMDFGDNEKEDTNNYQDTEDIPF